MDVGQEIGHEGFLWESLREGQALLYFWTTCGVTTIGATQFIFKSRGIFHHIFENRHIYHWCTSALSIQHLLLLHSPFVELFFSTPCTMVCYVTSKRVLEENILQQQPSLVGRSPRRGPRAASAERQTQQAEGKWVCALRRSHHLFSMLWKQFNPSAASSLPSSHLIGCLVGKSRATPTRVQRDRQIQGWPDWIQKNDPSITARLPTGTDEWKSNFMVLNQSCTIYC